MGGYPKYWIKISQLNIALYETLRLMVMHFIVYNQPINNRILFNFWKTRDEIDLNHLTEHICP